MTIKFLFALLIVFALLALPTLALAQDGDAPQDVEEEAPPVVDEGTPAEPVPVEDVDPIGRSLAVFAMFCAQALVLKESITKFRVKEALSNIPFLPADAHAFIIGVIAIGIGTGYFLLTGFDYLGQLPYNFFDGANVTGMAFLNGSVLGAMSFLAYDLLRKYSGKPAAKG